jgi:hypothetical protein
MKKEDFKSWPSLHDSPLWKERWESTRELPETPSNVEIRYAAEIIKSKKLFLLLAVPPNIIV